ncbi:FAD-dependent monooxygenase [Bradyrhizobium sp. CER78]|uniref:flavin-dependent monooxygenase QhpG n=1 Tax=Bradyrhizobium sp. CER78 TaxID=3039162 RepID=UPI00244BCD32|nr:FAD-dependent monooxygenase [Bradyrhizobium sp. CER78]MDH2380870.1 FAD-dependent monooxygenase [Bradyrhizobium sp. CER78]
MIGGGPAGAISARQLRRMGFHTCLIEARGPLRPVVGEALPVTTLRLLHQLGFGSAVAERDALRCDEIVQRWGDGDATARSTSVVMVDRGRFDPALVDIAAEAGVDVMCPARLRRRDETPEGWDLEVETGAGIVRVAARFLVDARGRRAAGSRPLGAATVALCARWRGVALAEQPQMRIEAADDAWLWGAPLADGSLVVQVFQRTADCTGLSPASREARYRAILRGAKLFSGCDAGVLIDPVRARDASCRVGIEPVTRNMIRIGDRCLAMDPLSSQGVQSAVRSALQGSVVANTILTGGDREAAVEFYRHATHAIATRHRETSAAFYAETGSGASPFWHERVGARRTSAGIEPGRRTLPSRVRLSPDAHLVDHPAIEGDIVRRRPALIHPRLGEPTAFAEGIALSGAITSIEHVYRVPDILARWGSMMPEATARALLDWLVRHDVLIDDDSSPTGPVMPTVRPPSASRASWRPD